MSDFEFLEGKPAAAYIWRANAKHGTGHQFIDGNNHYHEVGDYQSGALIVLSAMLPQNKEIEYIDAYVAERVVHTPIAGLTVGHFEGSSNSALAHTVGYNLLRSRYRTPSFNLDGYVRSGTPLAVATVLPERESIELFEQLKEEPRTSRDYAKFVLKNIIGIDLYGIPGPKEEFEAHYPAIQFATSLSQPPSEGLANI